MGFRDSEYLEQVVRNNPRLCIAALERFVGQSVLDQLEAELAPPPSRDERIRLLEAAKTSLTRANATELVTQVSEEITRTSSDRDGVRGE